MYHVHINALINHMYMILIEESPDLVVKIQLFVTRHE